MKVACVFATVVLLILGHHEADAVINVVATVANQVNRIREKVVGVQKLLTGALTGVLDGSSAFVDNIGRTFNSTVRGVEDQVKRLRERFPSSKYDVCFPHTYVFMGANHTIGGFVSCVNRTVQVATGNTATIIAQTSEIIKSLDAISDRLKVCNVLSADCIRLAIGILEKVATIATSAVTIGDNAAQLVSYFGTIQYSFAPCVVAQAKYLKMAADFVQSAVNCVKNIID